MIVRREDVGRGENAVDDGPQRAVGDERHDVIAKAPRHLALFVKRAAAEHRSANGRTLLQDQYQ